MTVTRDDLETTRVWIDYDKAEWREVEYGGKGYLLCTGNMTPEDIDEIASQDPQLALFYALGLYPTVFTYVFPAEKNLLGEWDIPGECDESCASGVCNRRIAQRHDVGDPDVAYSMLLDHLNA